MKKTALALVAFSFALSGFSQVFTSFSIKGSSADVLIKNTEGRVETIVDETFDIKNIDFKYKINSGTSIADSTPVLKDFTKAQYITLTNASEGTKTWKVIVNQLKPASLPFALNFNKNSYPCDLSHANPKAWAGYGIDYKRTDGVYFGDEGVMFYIALAPGAKEISYDLGVLDKMPLAGEFAVETSSDMKKWNTLVTYSESKLVGGKNSVSQKLKSDVKYVRWVYYTRVKQNVTLNNISVK